MSSSDANDWSPEQAAASGYPQAPTGSSPAEGADESGTPPVPAGAPPVPAQQPGPDHPRFQEVYGKWKSTERELEEARERLNQYESLENPYGGQMPTGAPPPPPQQQPTPSGQEDPETWLKNTVAEAVREHIAPLQQTFEQQQQTQRLAQAAAQFKAAHPEFDEGRDGQRLIGTFRRFNGAVPLEECYRMTYPERYAQAPQQAPMGAPAPLADVPGAAPQSAHGDSPQDLMTQLQNPNLSAYERDMIATKLRDMGAWGMGGAEKALGF